MKVLLRTLRYYQPDAPRIAIAIALVFLSGFAALLKPWPLAFMVDGILGNGILPALLEKQIGQWEKTSAILAFALMAFGLHVLHSLFSSAQNWLLIKIGLRSLARLRNQVFHAIQRMSLKRLQQENQGDLIYRVCWDTCAIQTLFQQGLFACFSAIVSLSLMVVLMWRINPKLTGIALVTIPFLLIIIRGVGGTMNKRSQLARESESRVVSWVQQGVASLPLTQSYTREKEEEGRFFTKVLESFKTRLSQHGCELAYLFFIALAFGSGTAVILWQGSEEVLNGKLSIGELLVFLAYLGMFYDPLNQLSHVGSTTSASFVGMDRIFEVLDWPDDVVSLPTAKPIVLDESEPLPMANRAIPPARISSKPSSGTAAVETAPEEQPQIADSSRSTPGPVYARTSELLLGSKRKTDANRTGNVHVPPAAKNTTAQVLLSSRLPKLPSSSDVLKLKGGFVFDHVTFGYQTGCTALQDVSFEVLPGECVVIMGPSGSGKTTLLNLLPRFFDPSAGRVFLDGVDLRDLRLKDLRENVALALQESYLLPGTIADNIAYGRQAASKQEIEEAAIRAAAADFIKRLPNSFDTVVGEGAARLSSGEKQRINLSRTLLKNTRIMVMDEPTSSLDAETERQVVAGLREIKAGKTLFISSHRMSLVQLADKILLLDQGRMVAFDRAETILSTEGFREKLSH